MLLLLWLRLLLGLVLLLLVLLPLLLLLLLLQLPLLLLVVPAATAPAAAHLVAGPPKCALATVPGPPVDDDADVSRILKATSHSLLPHGSMVGHSGWHQRSSYSTCPPVACVPT